MKKRRPELERYNRSADVSSRPNHDEPLALMRSLRPAHCFDERNSREASLLNTVIRLAISRFVGRAVHAPIESFRQVDWEHINVTHS